MNASVGDIRRAPPDVHGATEGSPDGDARLLRCIVVPLDGSELAERALPVAAALAARIGAELHMTSWVLRDTSVATRHWYLYETARAAAPGTTPTVGVHVGDSVVAGAELAALASASGTAVCMASHGHTGPGRVIFGSVAEAVVRTATQPVLVVGPHADAERLIGGHLLACVDETRASEAVIAPATRWAEALGLDPWIVHVSDPDAAAVVRRQDLDDDVAENGYVSSLGRRTGHDVNWDELHGHRAADAIVDFANGSPVGVVVLSTHSRTGWDRVRFGSVAAEVVRRAPCPVLLLGPRSTSTSDTEASTAAPTDARRPVGTFGLAARRATSRGEWDVRPWSDGTVSCRLLSREEGGGASCRLMSC
jgi:nucleotide-binding universal stress UspA family protein